MIIVFIVCIITFITFIKAIDCIPDFTLLKSYCYQDNSKIIQVFLHNYFMEFTVRITNNS